MKFFIPAPETLEELKKTYHRLALHHHPDHGGSTAEMQALNDEYDLLPFFGKVQKMKKMTPETLEIIEETLSLILLIPLIYISIVILFSL